MTKVISYLQAFSESCLLSHLIKWVMSQPGVQSKTNAPNVFTPVAVISEFLCYLCLLVFPHMSGFRTFCTFFCLVMILSKHVMTWRGFCCMIV